MKNRERRKPEPGRLTIDEVAKLLFAVGKLLPVVAAVGTSVLVLFVLVIVAALRQLV